MREEHLDLLPELHRDLVLPDFRDIPGDLASVFVFFAGNRSGICVRAAFRLGRAGLAGQIQGPVFGSALSGRPPARVGIVPTELLQLLALGADVLVVVRIPLEVGAGPGAVAAAGFVEHRDVRRDLAVDQPAQHRSCALGGVGDQAFGMQFECALHPLEHGLGRPDLGLADRSCGLHIHDDAMVHVDQAVVGIAEECRSLASNGPLAGRVGM